MSCDNTNFAKLDQTWSKQSDLHYSDWTPYGSDGCAPKDNSRSNATKESFCASSKCGKDINNTSSTKDSNLSGSNKVITENFGSVNMYNSINYSTLYNTWNIQKPYSL